MEREVTTLLKKEMNYRDHRAEDLKVHERAGRHTHLSTGQAAARANDLADRLQRRLAELAKKRDISALPPQVRGGAIVVPACPLTGTTPRAGAGRQATPEGRAAVERLAMAAVMTAERALGHAPMDVNAEPSATTSNPARTARTAFSSSKSRAAPGDADTVTVTRNEILTTLNKPDAFILAVVEVANGVGGESRYVRKPFAREPDFGATSMTYNLAELLDHSEKPGREKRVTGQRRLRSPSR